MSTPAGAPPLGAKGPAKGPGDWLKTKEGKLVAGGAAVLVVIVLALRKGSGGGGPSADQLQGGTDGTLQSQFDQLTGRGGTLEELVDTVSGLAGSAEEIRDLLEAQDPLPPTTPAKPPPKPAGTRPLPSGAKRLPTGQVVVPWQLSRSMSLRDVARQVSISKAPNAVESTLRGLVRLNPSLRGRRTVPQGMRIIVPDRRYYQPK